MHRLARIFAFAALLSAAGAAGADTPAPSDPSAEAVAPSADGPLNAVYRELVARFRTQPEARDALIEAQRAWLEFRDRECAFAARASGEPPAEATRTCRRVLTIQRLDRLNAYLSAP